MSSEKVSGRQLILATASDYEPAQAVADHLGLFDEVVASNGRENCKGATKLKHLRQRFGVNFDYVGNSRPDLPIWMESRNAVVVRVSSGLQKKAQARARVTRIFNRNRGFANSLIKC
jgi:phosphoserine phosphatase